mmetsp:Transcript_8998/g.27045  ORF Transcript_8998/g.27045 Transcript_8998/m.27045 type:complete len:344 (+) Transcript_8998:48-1079(+)
MGDGNGGVRVVKERREFGSLEERRWSFAGSGSPSNGHLSSVLSRAALSELVPDESQLELTEDGPDLQPASDKRIDRFREWLDAETYVDMAKIKRDAPYGLPAEVRAEVWKYLLGVLRPEKSDEISLRQNMQREYTERVGQIHDSDEVTHRVRGEVKRLKRKEENRLRVGSGDDVPKQEIDAMIYVRIISVYLSTSSSSVEYHADMIPLAAPFVHINNSESDAYYCFHSLMQRHEDMFQQDGLNKAVANFLTLLRVFYSEVMDHMEAEEIEAHSWAYSWFRTLLARQLRFSCVLRLWDTYFSTKEGLELHTYVCLAVLDWIRDQILEQEGQDIIGDATSQLPTH